MFRGMFAARRLGRAPRLYFQPRLETLEDRLAPAGYSPTDLGMAGDIPLGPEVLNNSGQIATAAFSISSNGYKVFLYNNGQWNNLNAPSGYDLPTPKDINDSGQILSSAENTQTKISQAFLYSNGTWNNLNAPNGYNQTLPEGLNNAGEVFVNTETQNSVSQAYLYNNGQWQPLSSEPSGYDSFEALGINNSGQLLVQAINGSGITHDFIYANSKWTDIGANASGNFDLSGDINDPGQAVLDIGGLNLVPNVFSYSNGKWSGPGDPSGYSNPILAGFNNTGQILIEASTGSGSSAVTHPFLYSDGQWTDLNSFMASGNKVTLTGTGGINNNGEIVADGSDGHIYLLQPDAAPVVTSDPTNQTVIVGGTVKFTASASGIPTPTGQWQVSHDGGQTWNDVDKPVTGNSVWEQLTGVYADANGEELRCVFSNGIGQAAITKPATLTVQAVPAFTSGNSAVFTAGQFGTFTVTATDFPTPTLTPSGALPSGVTFKDNGDGTATLAGTPTAGTQGTYHFTITASNAAGNDPQSFTLTINPAPAPPPAPSPPPAPPQPTPPALNVPPLLALFDGLLGGTESVNGNDTETITDSLFGIPLLVANFDHSGNLVSVTMFGINVTFLFA